MRTFMIKYVNQEIRSQVEAAPQIMNYLQKIEDEGLDHLLIYRVHKLVPYKPTDCFYKIQAINQIGEMVVLTFYKKYQSLRHSISWSDAEEFLRMNKKYLSEVLQMV